MRIEKINYGIKNTNFGYKSILKDMYNADKLPSVKIGLYGGKLSHKDATFEHIKCACDGGTTKLSNGALATKYNNNLRGNKDINLFLTKEKLYNYLIQFQDIIVEYKGKIFDGNKYILGVINTLKDIGFKF